MRSSKKNNKRAAMVVYCLLPIAYCLLLLLTATFSGCGTTNNTLVPLESELSKVHKDYPDATVADLQQGFTLYKMNCGGCHTLHLPNEKTKEQWAKLLPEMFLKTSLKDKEKLQITQYLFAKAN